MQALLIGAMFISVLCILTQSRELFTSEEEDNGITQAELDAVMKFVKK
jgi:hypothetical protein